MCAVCVNAPDEPRGFCHLQRPPGGGRANTSDTAGVCRGEATNSLIHSFTFCLPTPLSALTSTTRFLRRIICVIFLLAAFREKLTAWKQIKEKVFEIFSDVNESSAGIPCAASCFSSFGVRSEAICSRRCVQSNKKCRVSKGA